MDVSDFEPLPDSYLEESNINSGVKSAIDSDSDGESTFDINKILIRPNKDDVELGSLLNLNNEKHKLLDDSDDDNNKIHCSFSLDSIIWHIFPFLIIVSICVIFTKYNTHINDNKINHFCCPVEDEPYFLHHLENTVSKYDMYPNITNYAIETIFYCSEGVNSTHHFSNDLELDDVVIGIIMMKIQLIINIIFLYCICIMFFYRKKINMFQCCGFTMLFIIINIVLSIISLFYVYHNMVDTCLNEETYEKYSLSSGLLYNYENFLVFSTIAIMSIHIAIPFIIICYYVANRKSNSASYSEL